MLDPIKFRCKHCAICGDGLDSGLCPGRVRALAKRGGATESSALAVPISVCVVACLHDALAVSARRHNPSSWGLPGGKVEARDAVHEGELVSNLDLVLRRAAARELWEETGLIVDVDQLILVYAGVCRDQSGGGLPDTITCAFRALSWRGELHARPGEPPAKWGSWDLILDKSGAFYDYNSELYNAWMAR